MISRGSRWSRARPRDVRRAVCWRVARFAVGLWKYVVFLLRGFVLVYVWGG